MSERGATRGSDRISNLDVVRGVAVLGILTMNVTTFFLPLPAYSNISLPEGQSVIDWLVGAFGVVFFDQKFMGLFSMLFGAGIVLFADRAAARGQAVIRLSLWRNLLLLLIGVVHVAVWEGDVLILYALCSPFVLLVRRWSTTAVFSLGVAILLFIPLVSLLVQATVPESGAGLADQWGVPGPMSGAVTAWYLIDAFGRALAMMFIGVAAYRSGFVTGAWEPSRYRLVIAWNLPLGIGLGILGVAWMAWHDYSAGVALAGSIPKTLGTLPMVAAYVSLISLWHRRVAGQPLDLRLGAVGRMALTNYLSQTLIMTALAATVLADVGLGRALLVGPVLAVWALQLWWSKAWLDRFRQGPAEWLWRAATYRRLDI
jgi:uncharacterized protein